MWLLLVGVVVLTAACAGGPASSVAAPPPPAGSTAGMATPQTVPSAAVAATADLLRRSLNAAGFQFVLFNRPARPSEPLALTQVPRTVYQVVLPDPNGGLVVIYDFPDATAAATGAREMADYVGSGFGQTNFPTDAQFSVAQVGPTMVFTWWSRARSSDPTASSKAFAAVASVGQPVTVTK